MKQNREDPRSDAGSLPTPGPWTIAPCSSEDETRDIVADYSERDGKKVAHWIAELDAATDFDMSENEREEAMETLRANAQLIAAAPDLYAALKRLYDLPVDCSQEQDREAFTQARIAIAKAEGRTP